LFLWVLPFQKNLFEVISGRNAENYNRRPSFLKLAKRATTNMTMMTLKEVEIKLVEVTVPLSLAENLTMFPVNESDPTGAVVCSGRSVQT